MIRVAVIIAMNDGDENGVNTEQRVGKEAVAGRKTCDSARVDLRELRSVRDCP